MQIKGRHEDLIRETIAGFVTRAFPGKDPGLIEYTAEREPVCDADIFRIGALFSVSGGDVQLSFKICESCFYSPINPPQVSASAVEATWEVEYDEDDQDDEDDWDDGEVVMSWDDEAGKWEVKGKG